MVEVRNTLSEDTWHVTCLYSDDLLFIHETNVKLSFSLNIFTPGNNKFLYYIWQINKACLKEGDSISWTTNLMGALPDVFFCKRKSTDRQKNSLPDGLLLTYCSQKKHSKPRKFHLSKIYTFWLSNSEQFLNPLDASLGTIEKVKVRVQIFNNRSP